MLKDLLILLLLTNVNKRNIYKLLIFSSSMVYENSPEWNPVNDLAVEYCAIRDATGQGTAVDNRTERQKEIASVVVEK